MVPLSIFPNITIFVNIYKYNHAYIPQEQGAPILGSIPLSLTCSGNLSIDIEAILGSARPLGLLISLSGLLIHDRIIRQAIQPTFSSR